MAVKNIEMNYRNESGYDVLYPESILGNIVDWQDSIYSKSEVNGAIQTVQETIGLRGDCFMQIQNLHIASNAFSVSFNRPGDKIVLFLGLSQGSPLVAFEYVLAGIPYGLELSGTNNFTTQAVWNDDKTQLSFTFYNYHIAGDIICISFSN